MVNIHHFMTVHKVRRAALSPQIADSLAIAGEKRSLAYDERGCLRVTEEYEVRVVKAVVSFMTRKSRAYIC